MAVGRSGERQQCVRHVLALLVLQALHVHGLRAPAAARKSASLQGKLESFEETVVQFASGAGTVIVDGDNVRGKSGFAVSHMELVRATSIWGDQRGLEGRLVVCIDHGSSADAWYLSELGVAVCSGLGLGSANPNPNPDPSPKPKPKPKPNPNPNPNPSPSPEQVCFAGPVGTADDLIQP